MTPLRFSGRGGLIRCARPSASPATDCPLPTPPARESFCGHGGARIPRSAIPAPGAACAHLHRQQTTTRSSHPPPTIPSFRPPPAAGLRRAGRPLPEAPAPHDRPPEAGALRTGTLLPPPLPLREALSSTPPPLSTQGPSSHTLPPARQLARPRRSAAELTRCH